MTAIPVALRRYVVPGNDGDQGGTFVIGSDGYFSCITDWGNYVYFWNNFGDRDFRDFLCSLSADYVMGKFGSGTWSGGKADKGLRDGFGKKLWPRFQKVLKLELAELVPNIEPCPAPHCMLCAGHRGAHEMKIRA